MPAPATALEFVAVLSLIIWAVLFFAWGAFWQIWEWDADRNASADRPSWPRVVAVIPARNEAATIAEVLASLLKQDYPDEFSIIVVDDHSEDGTAELARDAIAPAAQPTLSALQGAQRRTTQILLAPPLEAGWTGKLWALNAGVSLACSASPAASSPEFFWCTDADIVHSPKTLRRLVARAEQNQLDLTSLMVRLKADTFAERLLIPPFLYFFLMLYPPKWIADPRAKTAGAAGGCILLRQTALERIGGLTAIRSEVIDDCALARAVKQSGGRIWMGLTRASHSVRSYATFSEIRDMIARTAFTQLRYSLWLLAGTLLGMALTFLAAPALAFSSAKHVWPFALAAWCLMTASFLPTIAFYRLSPLWAPLLPLAALFYTLATGLSAVRFWLGRGGQWKGRAQARNPSSRS